jgi:cytochrome b involved in lipid metabolism
MARSLARKGSFTARFSPYRVWSGLFHAWAVWGGAVARDDPTLSDTQRRQVIQDWHAWFWQWTGEVNDSAMKKKMRAEFGLSDAAIDPAANGDVNQKDVQELPVISVTELAQHKTRDDCWVAIDGVAYDVTAWVEAHPGGPTVLVAAAGTDVTADFEALQHSQYARDALSTMRVATLAL